MFNFLIRKCVDRHLNTFYPFQLYPISRIYCIFFFLLFVLYLHLKKIKDWQFYCLYFHFLRKFYFIIYQITPFVENLGRKLRLTRSGNSSPLHYITPIFNRSTLPSSVYPHHNSVAAMGSPYYRDMDEPTSPAGGAHHRSRSASRPPISHSMDYPSK